MNRDVIAIDQDPAGKQGKRLSQSGDSEIWVRDLADGSKAIALFNRGAAAADMTRQLVGRRACNLPRKRPRIFGKARI